MEEENLTYPEFYPFLEGISNRWRELRCCFQASLNLLNLGQVEDGHPFRWTLFGDVLFSGTQFASSLLRTPKLYRDSMKPHKKLYLM
jgi:hypothetical protein